MCFRLPATGGAPWTSTQDSFAAVRAQRTWKAVAYEWRQGLAAKEYINIHDTTWLSGSSVRAHPMHRPEQVLGVKECRGRQWCAGPGRRVKECRAWRIT